MIRQILIREKKPTTQPQILKDVEEDLPAKRLMKGTKPV